MGWHNSNVGQQSPKEVKMWKVGLGIPKQRIEKEMGWHGKNINPQVHGVTRSKIEGKAIVGTMKWYGETNNQKAH